MFIGLDDIDWGSLRHAYGSAEDVPGWVRGLVDPDPAVREESLDAMYGAVHHQGDVYDSTVAVVPYLIEALTAPDLPGRAEITSLLASIVSPPGEWPDGFELHADAAEVRRQAMRANALALAAAPALIRLADDPDPAVRAAVPRLLVAIAEKIPDLPALFINLLRTEDDAEVRRALFDALGGLELDDDVIGNLLGLARSAPASTALAALIAVARKDPDRVPLDGVPDLIDRAYAEDGPAAEPAGFQTNTLIGRLRLMREEMEQGRRAPHCTRMVEQLTDPLGHRVSERLAIITPLLASPHDDLAEDALWAVNKLIKQWRGDYREVATLSARFFDRSPKLEKLTTDIVKNWGPIAAPATEAIARRLAALDAQPWRDGFPAWIVRNRYQEHIADLHPYIEILADFGDERALPLLLTALTLPHRDGFIGYKLARYPAHAERITAELVRAFPAGPVNGDESTEWLGFLAALRAFGPAAAPAVPHLLASPLTDNSASTLGRIGPAAAEALPALRVAAASDDARLAVAAAGALWRIDQSMDALALLTKHLDGPAAAFEEIGAMGPAGASVAPLVAGYLDVEQDWWIAMHAAITLWRLTDDVERVAPVLTAVWNENERSRPKIAKAAAGDLTTALQPLFRAELARNQRIKAIYSKPSPVIEDEQLLELCRAAAGQV